MVKDIEELKKTKFPGKTKLTDKTLSNLSYGLSMHLPIYVSVYYKVNNS